MSYSKRLTYSVLALGCATIALLLYALDWTKSAELSNLPPILSVLGNFHPLLLHLPIGIFIYLGFAETWNFLDRAWLKRGQIRGDVPILAFGTVTAVFAAFAGLLLYLQGDYSGELIDLHMNWGIGFAIGSIIVLCSALIFQEDSQIYRLVLFIVIAALTFTGHQGGLITHGDPLEPLFEDDQAAEVAKPVEELLTYDVVDKIFQARCYNCHSTGKKQKGELLLDSYEALLAGGKKGNALVPGNLEESKISTYPHLPLDHKYHMPPEGKPQLTAQELEFIDEWILSGASPDALLIEQELTEEQLNWAIDYMANAPLPVETQTGNIEDSKEDQFNFDPLIADIEQHALNSLSRVGPGGQHLVFSAINARETFNSDGVDALMNAGPYLIEIDLSNTMLEANDVQKLLQAAPQLARLNLSGTLIDSQIIEPLIGLEPLESLILFDAQLAPNTLSLLSSLKQLHSLYLAGTGLSPTQVEQLRQALPGVEVVADDYLSRHNPKPPEEIADEDSAESEIKSEP